MITIIPLKWYPTLVNCTIPKISLYKNLWLLCFYINLLTQEIIAKLYIFLFDDQNVSLLFQPDERRTYLKMGQLEWLSFLLNFSELLVFWHTGFQDWRICIIQNKSFVQNSIFETAENCNIFWDCMCMSTFCIQKHLLWTKNWLSDTWRYNWCYQ